MGIGYVEIVESRKVFMSTELIEDKEINISKPFKFHGKWLKCVGWNNNFCMLEFRIMTMI